MEKYHVYMCAFTSFLTGKKEKISSAHMKANIQMQ